jgi:hypothetical protein
LEVGSNFTAEGKIKSQRDNSTQLNYVKMVWVQKKKMYSAHCVKSLY